MMFNHAAPFARPGNYGDYLMAFRMKPPDELRKLHASLPSTGCGWPRANYRLALERAMRECEA